MNPADPHGRTSCFSTGRYIIAAVGDQPDAKAAADRLMKNQDDIGNAVGKFYGAPAGQQLTMLLSEFELAQGHADRYDENAPVDDE